MTLEELGFEVDGENFYKREYMGDIQRINIQPRFNNVSVTFGYRSNWYSIPNEVILALAERIKNDSR